jgi:hypothetical protein
MRKGTENRLGALLQGLLATFTGGSLILFAVLAATIGLSTPQGESPSIAEGGSRSGGSVTVPGLGQDNQTAPRTGTAATEAPTEQGPAAPGAPAGGATTTVVADSSETAPSDSGPAEASSEFGFSVPQILTPDDNGTISDDPIGPPIGSPGAFIPTTDDELPDSFKKRFRTGNALGARDVDKADRVDRRAARKAARKADKAASKPTNKAKATKDRGGKRSAAGTSKKKADKVGRASPSGSSDAKETKKAGRDHRRESRQADKQAKQADKQANKESKQADKQAKKESKEAKKEEKGRTVAGDDDKDSKDDD